MHAELLSGRGEHRLLPEKDHNLLLMDRHDALQVARAIVEVLRLAR